MWTSVTLFWFYTYCPFSFSCSSNWPFNISSIFIGFYCTLLSLLCLVYILENRKGDHEFGPYYSSMDKKLRESKLALYILTKRFLCLPMHSYIIWNRQDFLTCQMLYVSIINFCTAYLLLLIGRKILMRKEFCFLFLGELNIIHE